MDMIMGDLSAGVLVPTCNSLPSRRRLPRKLPPVPAGDAPPEGVAPVVLRQPPGGRRRTDAADDDCVVFVVAGVRLAVLPVDALPCCSRLAVAPCLPRCDDIRRPFPFSAAAA